MTKRLKQGRKRKEVKRQSRNTTTYRVKTDPSPLIRKIGTNLDPELMVLISTESLSTTATITTDKMPP